MHRTSSQHVWERGVFVQILIEMGNCGSSPAAEPKATGGQHSRQFAAIRDRFESIDEVQNALREAGLESSDLIVAIDLTKSNEWSGKHSFNGALAWAT